MKGPLPTHESRVILPLICKQAIKLRALELYEPVRLTSRAKACGERKMGLHGEFVLPSLTHSLRRRAKCTYKIVNPVRTVCSHYQNTSKKGWRRRDPGMD
jgi:hypothetical protein